MNNIRRKKIKEIIDNLNNLHGRIEEVLSEEQDAYDNMPEGLQMSDNGMACEDAIDKLEDSMDNLNTAVEILEEIL